MKKIIYYILVLIGILYVTSFHYTDTHQLGITYNLFNGEINKDDRSGFHFTLPWVLTTKIDLRPHKVCIVSATRNINCRLVQFNPDKFMELIKFEGFSYYWWYNRFSFNSGQITYRGVDNLLLGHAYGTNKCSCVEVITEIGDGQ